MFCSSRTKLNSISSDILKQAQIPPRTRRLLFKTRNSALWLNPEAEFKQDFVAITADGANFLVEHGIKLVGVDYLSVAPFNAPIPNSPHPVASRYNSCRRVGSFESLTRAVFDVLLAIEDRWRRWRSGACHPGRRINKVSVSSMQLIDVDGLRPEDVF